MTNLIRRLNYPIWSIFILCSLSGFALGSTLNSGWNRDRVKPIVLCRYDSFYGFIPIGSEASVTTPTWTKEQVTPIAKVIYENYSFRPKNSGGLTPEWEKDEVEPWVEVIPGSGNEFVIK